MNIILFGPPGIGKSTIIGTLKTLGQRAIDLEDLYPSRLRFQIPNCTSNKGITFLGAADLDPKRNYGNSKKVLLTMDQLKYEARRSSRDQAIPQKANQAEHRVKDWEAGVKYDWILDVSSSPNKVANLLIQHYVDGGRQHGN